VSNQIEKSFSSVSFSNHFLIVTKSKTLEQALFYLQKSSSEFWSYRTLEHQLKANLYAKEGKLPNNFIETLPEKLSNNAIQVFKDEYLLDFINIEDPDEMYKNILPDADSLKRLLE
jgi:predicted nuclease of restriction endonuclease-like (RecB) superfamily